MRVQLSRIGFWLTAATVFLAGCASTAETTTPAQVPVVEHPLGAPSPAQICCLSATTQDPHTRVYLVNGLDPFGWAAIDKLAERIRRSGYPNTRYGEAYDIIAFEEEIRKVHAEDPSARFALIGFDIGTLAVRITANRLLRDGIPVAMLGYIGGDYLTDEPYSRPPGVERVVNVTGNGFLLTGQNLFWSGTDLTGASNARLQKTWHFDLPTNPRTLAMIVDGLAGPLVGP